MKASHPRICPDDRDNDIVVRGDKSVHQGVVRPSTCPWDDTQSIRIKDDHDCLG